MISPTLLRTHGQDTHIKPATKPVLFMAKSYCHIKPHQVTTITENMCRGSKKRIDALEFVITSTSARILYMNVLSRLDTPTGKLEGSNREHICTKQVLLTDIVRPEISSSWVAVFTGGSIYRWQYLQRFSAAPLCGFESRMCHVRPKNWKLR